ncbi:PH domain-containing protein [Rhodococcus sp. BP-252]|uniref:PH domain-containing protein n=1 Tax=unclassified Rhodococcus (in: high G+C Gram-positive bacteria) TaxID=192944 RepID=UPI000DF251B7|nr:MULTISPECIES: PH domain-containing protein [unclassified Rhodococcus (in: high G+C Gram-positive bacteria)]MBY6414103.1 PH domain-containing protein [Rhodococcus sp. BP-320]MBY6418922.1 PH domain-containing protein [Rhodococcus sp. BP-321]MBY6423619.1 PH domain-containing protein [Rhodococcus sp. BP-324]MBY6428956.1 PH domain-containing protein [Rhodococcus sp. BP-323]MBY6433961.1 PH domain-containing protein [Rhodococcus sp. BP-322]
MGFMDGLIGNAGKIDPAVAHQEYSRLLGNGEQIHAAYQLVRDAFLFTNRRLLMIDKQGLTGKKVEYHSVLYRSITHFAVETAGTFDLDAELKIWISGNAVPIQKQFTKQVDIYEVQAILSHFVVS